jgi:hypothetical protein
MRWSTTSTLGRYAFTLPDTVARGKLQPLRVQSTRMALGGRTQSRYVVVPMPT